MEYCKTSGQVIRQRGLVVKRCKWFSCFVGIVLVQMVACDFRSQRHLSNEGGASEVKEKSEDEVSEGNDTSRPSLDSDSLENARAAIADKDFERAEELLRRRLIHEPDNPQSFMLLGDIALLQGRPLDAVSWFRNSLDVDKEFSPELANRLAELLMTQGRVFESVELLAKMVSKRPNVAKTRFELAGLASMVGLQDIVKEQLIWLQMHNQGDFESLVVMAQPHQVQPDPELCQKSIDKYPADLRPAYGLAKLDAMQLNWDGVVSRLRPVLDQHPDFDAARALLIRGLVETQQTEDLLALTSQRASELSRFPHYWIAAGTWALQQGQADEAASAFKKAVDLEDGNNGEVLTLLGAALARMGLADDLGALNERNAALARLHDATKKFYERGDRSQLAALQVARAMRDLGRIWEAEAWARHSLQLNDERVSDAAEQYLSFRNVLTVETPWQIPVQVLEDRVVAKLPSFSWKSGELLVDDEAEQADALDFRFQQEESARGLVHTTSVAPQAGVEGHWIYQSNGGGAAAIDMDLDTWPDLVLAVLDGEPMKENSGRDRLFRNLEGHFVDVTERAGLHNTGFTQGIATGDYDSDGFPDLLVCNIGYSKLYRNQGDGTFIDVSKESGLQSQHWTSSAVMTDLDGDGVVDIYLVNYCGGSRPFEKPCRNRTTGKYSSCTPVDFEAEPDVVFKGVGDGTFSNVTTSWGVIEGEGRGLGLVVGNIDEREGLDIYVANDMTANFLWSANNANKDGSFSFTDIGIARGVALSGQSLSQASMGIAIGDADMDADLDLFVTHFYEEHNTLYEQITAGVWLDRSYASGLAQLSMQTLGFGTQFLDIDNNGQLELVVANGHVSDLRDREIPYQMAAQVFSRSPKGIWTEFKSDALGEYFRQLHLGRALLFFDANHDGMQDILITHLYEPVALLINRSKGPRKECESIGVRLCAVKSHRDAVGASIVAEVGDSLSYCQLTSGDGYMCSNERRLSISSPNGEGVKRMTVTWPSGELQVINGLNAGGEYLLVEGCEPFLMFEHE